MKLNKRYRDLYDYANEYWPGHYNKAVQSGQLQAALVKFLDSGLENWAEWHDAKQTKETRVLSEDLLTTAITFGPDDLRNVMLDKLCFDAGALQTALDVAVQRGNEPLICKLHELGARDSKVLHIASSYGQYQVLETLIKHQADLTSTNSAGLAPLHLAYEANCLPMVEALVQRKVDIHARVEEPEEAKILTIGSTPLHIASQVGHTEITEKLLESKADPKDVDKNDSMPLHLACKWQQPEAVKLLLTRMKNVSVVDKDHRTPLHTACETECLNVVDLLLKYQKSMSVSEIAVVKDNQRKTPLHYVVSNGHAKVAEKLKSFWGSGGISEFLSARDVEGYISLHLASEDGQLRALEIILSWDKECVEKRRIGLYADSLGGSRDTMPKWEGFTLIATLLLNSEADVNVADVMNNTPLHLATLGGFTGTVQVLLQHNAKITLINDEGSTPLHLAANKGNLKLFKIFLDLFEKLPNSGKSTNLKNNLGDSAIMLAVKNRPTDVLKELKNATAEESAHQELLFLAAISGHSIVMQDLLKQFPLAVNTRNSGGNTLLHLASQAGDLEGVEFLLEGNADLTAINKENESAFALTSNSGVAPEKTSIPQVDEKDEEQHTTLRYATEAENVSTVRLLLEFGADPNNKDDEGYTVLHMAAGRGAKPVVRELLSSKKININEEDKSKATPIYLAAFSGHSDIVSCPVSYGQMRSLTQLLDAKAQINAQNDDGDTTLACAVRNGYQDSTKLLLENDADLFMTNTEERTSLHIAAYSNNNNKEILELLLKYALPTGNTHPRDRDGKTPLHMAAQNSNVEILEVMLKYVSPGDAGIKDNSGKTSLTTATLAENVEGIEKLFQSDVDVLALDNNKHTSPWHTIEKDNVKIANLILEKVDLESHLETAKRLKLRGSDERVFNLVVSEENILLIERILQSDNGKGWRDEHGWTLTDVSENCPSSYEKRSVDPQWKRPSSLSITVKCPDDYEEPASIRADHPIPPVEEFYFEVTIIDEGLENRGKIAVGFGYKSANSNYRSGLGSSPWRYHGEDGVMFSPQSGSDSYGTYGKDDIIGCCVDPVKRVAYFTRNGKRLGTHLSRQASSYELH
ncbi:hypothetical protein EYC80_004543 [Monilinia laxa]|uniref:B30.2/SPRY domain-containing protein n=1 Tax=Monilinia laxa TaxID=61186 RepID=A0A5N6KH28_MONLA|nr:hypothetical protein EYC80_004543 [Monilinia laxa]